ncbi:hypothetical protein JCM10449v2_001121 [Rhodotorula kratochvilovae]
MPMYEGSGSLRTSGDQRFAVVEVPGLPCEFKLSCDRVAGRSVLGWGAAPSPVKIANGTVAFVEVVGTGYELSATQFPNDVCLDFRQLGRQLWTTEATLTAASPYFKDLLASAFSEGVTATTNLSSAKTEKRSYTFEESDDETDALELPAKAQKEPGAPFKRIPVIETSYTTYVAVLVWIQTQHIAFAPLLSSFGLYAEGVSLAQTSRRLAVKALKDAQHPSLPPPASPMSIYRLADLLSLPALKSLALGNLVSQLTPQNAAYELYSDVATCYAPVRDAVLEYVVERWGEVKRAKGTAEMERRATDGELAPETAGTSMRLARALAEKLGG